MKNLLTLTALALFTASTAFGADAEVYRTPDLLGKTVKNKAGETIGQLEDLVIDQDNGHVVYAVLSSGETLGFGGKMFALPLGAFQMAENLQYLMIDAKKDEFEKAEGFDANKWPTKCDERFSRFNKTPIKDDGKEKTLRRLSSFKGMSIKNDQAETLGSVAGFAVDKTNGKVVYAALAYGGVGGVGAKYFAVPWNALHMKSLSLKESDRCFVLDAKKSDFENSAGFDKNSWPVKGEERFKKSE